MKTPSNFDDADIRGYEVDDLSFDGDCSTALAVEEQDEDANVEAADWTGPRCEKCTEPLRAEGVAICRDCGWYPSLNTFVEVDPSWAADDEQESDLTPRPQTSHVRVWFELIPAWSWVIIGSVLAIIVESVVARFATGAGSSLRTTWSLTQLAIGLVLVIACHVANFLVQVSDDPDVGLFDILLKPLKLWLHTFRRLPARLWLVDGVASGAVAVFMSIVVIGGLPYERLWDWGFTPPAKQELMGAVMDRVKQMDSGGSDNLEDAIGDFAGKGGMDDDMNAPPAKPRKTADCVILGYTVDNKDRLNTLVLGTAHLGKLVYAGNVTPKFASSAESAEMQRKLSALRTQQRTLPIQTVAIWVKPSITCRVTYGERQTTGRLNDVQWGSLLGTMRTNAK